MLRLTILCTSSLPGERDKTQLRASPSATHTRSSRSDPRPLTSDLCTYSVPQVQVVCCHLPSPYQWVGLIPERLGLLEKETLVPITTLASHLMQCSHVQVYTYTYKQPPNKILLLMCENVRLNIQSNVQLYLQFCRSVLLRTELRRRKGRRHLVFCHRSIP